MRGNDFPVASASAMHAGKKALGERGSASREASGLDTENGTRPKRRQETENRGVFHSAKTVDFRRRDRTRALLRLRHRCGDPLKGGGRPAAHFRKGKTPFQIWKGVFCTWESRFESGQAQVWRQSRIIRLKELRPPDPKAGPSRSRKVHDEWNGWPAWCAVRFQ